MQVTRGDVVEAVGATGTLEAVTTVQVGTQVSGTIKELHADFNSIVRSGQVIARLDPSLFQTQIEQARANLVRSEAEADRLRVAVDDAQTKLKRAQELSARSLIPQQDLEAAEITLRAAEAQVRSAQAAVTQARASLNQNEVNLQHTVIEAPIDGIVISRSVDVGQTVAASLNAPTLFVIAADLTKMRVNANIDEADVGRIRPGQVVRFRVDAYASEEFDGTVSQVRLQPQVVQNVVTYNTVIDVPNPAFKLKPGMTANVSIEVARRNDVLRIPNAALRFRPTPDMFVALGQTVPPELERGPGRTRSGARALAGNGTDDVRPDRSGPQRGGNAAANGVANQTGDDRPATSAKGATPPGVGTLTNGSRRSSGGNSDAGDGGGNGAGNADERRRRMLERLESMPHAEREQVLARMRARGFDPTSAASGQAAVPERKQTSATPRWQRAQSVDALFGPLTSTETPGRAWRAVNGRLEPVRLRLGISDGTATEVRAGDIAPDTQVVTSVVLPNRETPQASPAGGQSPLMGPQPRRGPVGVRNSPPSR
jgi:HlyD family secretion protein